jgi:hypothetical protein
MKDKQWAPWIELVRGYWWSLLSDDMPERWKRVVAAALAVAKWHPDNPNRGNAECSWCAYQVNKTGHSVINGIACINCPVKCKDRACPLEGSLWKNWYIYQLPRRADKMYTLLLDIYREEYEKVMK